MCEDLLKEKEKIGRMVKFVGGDEGEIIRKEDKEKLRIILNKKSESRSE